MSTAIEISVKPTLWMRIREFFASLVTPIDLPPRDDRWGSHDMNADVLEKHWRYSRSYYGVERALWML